MKIGVLRNLSDKEIKNNMYDLAMKIFNIKINKKFASKEDLHKIKFIRRDVARMLTILNQRKKINFS
jgi:ribosomal protein L29